MAQNDYVPTILKLKIKKKPKLNNVRFSLAL